MASFLLMGFLFACSNIASAAHCTQQTMPCWNNDPGLALYCTGPTSSTPCYSGGCGSPVDGPVECSDDPIE